MSRSMFTVFIALLFHTAAFSATIYVPDNFPNLQIAITLSSDGDTIIVRHGTYRENVRFLGRAITVESESGAELTVIDADQRGPAVSFLHGEGANSVLRGFTLTNGVADFDGEECRGGGVVCDFGSSPTLMENIIRDNYAEFGGGGISCNNASSPLISNNIILNNEAGMHGGGVYCQNGSNARIEANTIDSNRAGFALKKTNNLSGNFDVTNHDLPGPVEPVIYSGGGVYSNYSSTPIVNNIVTGNEGKWHGGGILCNGVGFAPVVEGNTVYENVAEKGAGIYCCHNFSDLPIKNNTVYENTASHFGGGICCRDMTASVENNTIFNNNALQGGGLYWDHADGVAFNNCVYDNVAQGGGGIFVQNAEDITLSNNSFFNNSADYGGGVAATLSTEMLIVNTILSDNMAPQGPEVWIGGSTGNSTVTVHYSLVKKGEIQIYTEPGSTLIWGGRIIETDPKWINSQEGNFHLTWLSPCINRGTFDHSPAADFDGDLRPSRGTVDIGADEYVNVHPLDADTFQLPQGGGAIHFALFGDLANAHRNYLLLGSMSGNAPGFSLPGDLVRFPLNWDPMTDLTLLLINSTVFSNFLGKLDGAGHGQAVLNAPPLPPGHIGTRITFAFCLNNPFDFASNPLPAEIVP